ncbi:TetR/AcrR family transcriptional regulator [Nocardia callitridis]|uniref:HTH tetR-type domain-containing protein n=1 Tax=Nocardia callitridis TaxID=648753 RepID=A0ABP9KV32_9NOCA
MAEDTAEPPIGLREQKKRKTLLDLCQAARRSVLEHGLDATTVEGIAKTVGVSPRTFFNYYDTKMDAVVGPIELIGTPETREHFIAGGPTGVLINDLVELQVPDMESEGSVREGIMMVTEIVHREPRVLAAFMAAGAAHEAEIHEILNARLGEEVSSDLAAMAASIMTTITVRAATMMLEDSTTSLREAMQAHCAAAARLFDHPHNSESGRAE